MCVSGMSGWTAWQCLFAPLGLNVSLRCSALYHLLSTLQFRVGGLATLSCPFLTSLGRSGSSGGFLDPGSWWRCAIDGRAFVNVPLLVPGSEVLEWLQERERARQSFTRNKNWEIWVGEFECSPSFRPWRALSTLVRSGDRLRRISCSSYRPKRSGRPGKTCTRHEPV